MLINFNIPIKRELSNDDGNNDLSRRMHPNIKSVGYLLRERL